MLATVRQALHFMSPKERLKYYTFLFLRAVVGVFDLIGILAIGFLATSIALFVTLGSDASRTINFGGFNLPAVNAQSLPLVAGIILALFLAKAVLSILLTRTLAHFLALIEARAARQVAAAAFGSGLAQARKYSREDIYFAVQAGSPAAFNSLLNYTGTLVAEGTLFLLVMAAFFVMNPLAAIVTLAYFGLVGWLMQSLIGGRMKRASQKVNEGTVQANAGIGDLSEALKEATVLGKKDFFLERIHQSRIKAASNFATQFVLNGMPRYIIETALILAVSLFVLYQAIQGDLVSAAGTLGVFLSGGLRLTASLLPLQSALLSMKAALPPANTALGLLEDSEPGRTVPEDKPSTALEKDMHPQGDKTEAARVEISNLYFSYPNSAHPTIQGLNLRIEPGQQVALIGESGAGKSTIADLILGLLRPEAGDVKIDGQAPSEIVNALPGHLAYVPQKPGLVSGTIADNIALGVAAEDRDERCLESSIQKAHLKAVIDALPAGIETDIGKRKDELSGGQLQRIGLARALYTNPGLLIMDEATSALDAESESEINRALNEMRGNVTVILIAHRLNTIQHCDNVFLIENGTVAAEGEFQTLLQTNAKVKELVKLMSVVETDDE